MESRRRAKAGESWAAGCNALHGERQFNLAGRCQFYSEISAIYVEDLIASSHLAKAVLAKAARADDHLSRAARAQIDQRQFRTLVSTEAGHQGGYVRGQTRPLLLAVEIAHPPLR